MVCLSLNPLQTESINETHKLNSSFIPSLPLPSVIPRWFFSPFSPWRIGGKCYNGPVLNMGVAAVFASGISASQSRPRDSHPPPPLPPYDPLPFTRLPCAALFVCAYLSLFFFFLFFFLFLFLFAIYFSFIYFFLDIFFLRFAFFLLNIYHIFRLFWKFHYYSSNVFPKSCSCHNIQTYNSLSAIWEIHPCLLLFVQKFISRHKHLFCIKG